MIEKWTKTEKKLNKLFASLGKWSKTFASKKTPPKIKESIEKSKIKSKEKALEIKKKSIENGFKALQTAKVKKDKATEKVRAVNKKANLFLSSDNKKSIIFGNAKKISLAIAAVVSSSYQRLENWLSTLSPKAILGGTVAAMLTLLTAVNIISQSRRIASSTTPASTYEEEATEVNPHSRRRPAYFKMESRLYLISNLILPAYLANRGMQKLNIDFILVTSNRYVTAYLVKKAHVLQDALNTRIEPVDIDFPLEDEGKRIIKEKIIEVVDDLLKELKVEGHVEDVHIGSIIGA